jgi:hypothetical protein
MKTYDKLMKKCLSLAKKAKKNTFPNPLVGAIVYDEETTQKMIDGAVARVTDLFNIYSAGGAPYQYLETNDMKYRAYDDLARIGD